MKIGRERFAANRIEILGAASRLCREKGVLIAMPRVRMSPAWFGELDLADNVEWIDTEQRGLVLRVRRDRLAWFVRYVFEAQARRLTTRRVPFGWAR